MSDVSKEYGLALYELARDEGLVYDLLGELRVVRDIIAKNPGFLRIIGALNIPKHERAEIVGNAFDGHVHQYITSFLKLMTERGHSREIIGGVREFEQQYYANEGIVIANVESAVALADKQKNQILAHLERKTGKVVELICRVKPDLIGGVRILVGGTLIEGSVSAKLDGLRNKLSNTTL